MANALLEIETLDGDQLKELIGRVVPLSIDLDSTFSGTRDNGANSEKSEVPQSMSPGTNMPPPLPSS
jgi:cell division protease FtsH